MTNTTILFIPGSFAPPTGYQNVIELLGIQGYPAVAVQLPSTLKRAPLEPATMEEDADVIKRAAETLIGLGRDVVAICHSYGGVPTTQGLAGVPVKRIIYLAATVPKVGQTLIDTLELPDSFLPPAVSGYMHVDAITYAGLVANDLPWEQAYPLALQLQHHSRASFDQKVSQAAYTNVPVTYIVTEKDLIISPEKQKVLIKVIEEAGGVVQVETMDSGHCPNWSQPGKLVEIIIRNAQL